MDSNRGEKRHGGWHETHSHELKRARVGPPYRASTLDDLYDCPPPQRARRMGGLPSVSEPSFSLDDVPTNFSLPTDTYTYEPFNLPDQQIRLISIRPGARYEAIQAHLHTVNLDDAPRYEALSYFWGEDPARHPITVDGKTVHVKDNLRSALKTLRSPMETRTFWIDALCINQQSPAERNNQVALMAKIYSQAERVVCWLGEGSSDSDIAFAAMNSLLQPETVQVEGHSNDDDHISGGATRTWVDEYGCIAFGRLIGREWFCRAWIVQEIAYAKEAILLCGDREIHWEDFVDSVRMVQSKLDSIKESLQSSPLLGSDLEALDNFKNSPATALLDVLESVFLKSSGGTILHRRIALETLVSDLAPFQATDPRDKIYALLSLAQDGKPLKTLPALPSDSQTIFQHLTADYQRSNLDVYSDFISRCIITSGSLDVITRPWAPLRRTKWHKKFLDPDLRFWVPSWISILDDLPFGVPKKGTGKRTNADTLVGKATTKVYNASNSMRAQFRFGINEADRTFDGCLFAKGVAIGTVTELSTRMADGIVLRDCLEMIGGIERTSEGQLTKMSDAVWRILCGNRDDLGRSASPVSRYALLHLLQRLPPNSSIDTVELLESDLDEYVREFLKRVQAVTWNRKVALISSPKGEEERRIGLVPTRSQVGDTVCILLGGSVPFVLRKHNDSAEECWELIGESYVEGQMDGEAVSCSTEQELNSQIREFAIR